MSAPPRRLSLSFVVVDCSGEMLSDAIDIAAALRDRGHTIGFAAVGALADRVTAAGFAVTPVTAGRLGRVEGLDQWLRARASDAVHLFGHGGAWSTARAARRLRTPLYWTVGDQAPAAVPPVGVLIAYSAHVGRRLAANRRLRLEHVVVEPARIACSPVIDVRDGDTSSTLGSGGGASIVVATGPAEPATLPGLEQAAAAVARLRRDGHDVVLLHVGGGSAMLRLRRSLERQASGTSVVPSDTADVPPIDLLRVAVAVLGSGRSAYRGMLADRPTLVLGVNGYAGDCTTAHVEMLSAYDFAGTNVTRRNDRAGVDQLVASLRPLLERRADERVWLGNGWARARVGADVAAVTYERLYLRRRPVPRGGAAALCRYEALRLAGRPVRVVRGATATRFVAPAAARSRRQCVDPGHRGPEGTAQTSGADRDVVVHVFADAGAPATRAQIAVVLRLRAAGWTSIVVLPTAGDWSKTADVCADAGIRVVRVAAAPPGAVAACWHGARMIALLRARLDRWGAAVVHAHDDAAALVWGLAARAGGVPLVWDADLGVRAMPLDRIRFAVASYLVVAGSGRRLTIGRRLPPHHHHETSPQADARALERALEQLTGRVAAPAEPSAAHGPTIVSLVDHVDHVDVGR